MAQHIAIVGVGPRGVSVIDRIGAAQPSGEIQLHLIDDVQLGAGRIWDTAQTRTLCMNTLAGDVTLFTEPGSTVTAPVRVGPTMFEWIQLLRGEELSAEDTAEEKTALFNRFAPALSEDFAEEIAATRPESNPSRAFYGEYIRWCYRVAVQSLPENVQVTERTSRAVAIHDAGEHDEVELANGERLTANATIIASGWTPPELTPQEQELAAASGTWIAPNNPLDQKVSAIPESGNVLVRGMGMGFFDVMALLTFDRGGKFLVDESARSGLRYEPSGREPHLYVSSGRGYPYLPKSEYKSLPPKAELRRLRAVIARLQDAECIDFSVQVWPAIVQDAYEAYYRVLAEQNPQALGAELEQILDAIEQSTPENIDAALAEFIPRAEDRFNLGAWKRPLDGFTGSIEELSEHIAQGMARDIVEAVAARDSALKAGLWSISASRKPAMILGSQGRFTLESRNSKYREFMALGQMVGSGPPLFRTRQLLALVDAGLVSFVGQRPTLRVEGEEFVLHSPTTNTEVWSGVLVDAWMHQPDIRHNADPLFASLAGRLRPFCEYDADGRPVETGSPEVHPISRALVRPDGSEDPRVMLLGIPTYAQMPDTTISPMPGTDPLFLQETDKAAVHALR